MIDQPKARLPLVSIIVITFNSSRYVLETLESAKSQTYKNIELIITDDCSIDNTVDICQIWLKENSCRFVRTKMVTSLQNTGIPANCNRGIMASCGEWVKLIAGDDCLYSEAIEINIYYVVNNNDVRVLFSSIHEFLDDFSKDNFIGERNNTKYISCFSDNITANQQYRQLLLGDFIGYTSSCFIFRKTLMDVGGYDERFKHIEDYPMWLKLTRNGIKLHYHNVVTVKYRRHIDSVHNHYLIYIKKPSFFKNEKLREELVYPHLSSFYYAKYKYRFIIMQILRGLGLNKINAVNYFLYRFLIFYFNFFELIEYILRTFFNKHINKFNF